MLGRFSDVYCPTVCAECRGPIRYYNPTGEWYCSPQGENLIEVDWMEISERTNELQAYASPHGALAFIMASALVLYPLFAILPAALAIGRARSRRARVPGLDRQIAALDASRTS